MRDPAASSRPTVAGVGCPYELGPTEITATLGRVSARNADVVEYLDPWCATLSTSMGGPRAQMLPTAASLGPVQSPVKRKLLPPASRRSTMLSLLASPERPAGLSTSARAEVLSPAGLSGDANSDSVVLRLDAGGRSFLFTSDCTGPNEAAVGSICARGPPIDVLKVAHHGSRYSTTSAFLADTRPRVAVICVGPNSYGHPTPATVGRLLAAGSRVYTTWKNGGVTFTVSAAGALSVSFARSSQPLKKATAAPGSTSRSPT